MHPFHIPYLSHYRLHYPIIQCYEHSEYIPSFSLDIQNFCLSFLPEPEVEISIPLENKKCLENDSVSFCVTLSKDTDAVKWLKDGQDITGKFDVKIEGKKHILTIPSASLEDAGEVTFTVGDKQTTSYLVVEGVFLD